MRVAIFSNHKYDQESFEEANRSFKHDLVFLTATLESATASLASGFRRSARSSTIAAMHPSWNRLSACCLNEVPAASS